MNEAAGYIMKENIGLIVDFLEDNKRFSKFLKKNRTKIDEEIKKVLNLSDGGYSILSELSEIMRSSPARHHPMDQYINSVIVNNFEIKNNNPLVKIAHYLDMRLEQLDAMISLVHNDSIEQDERDNLIDSLWFIYEEYSYENNSFLN